MQPTFNNSNNSSCNYNNTIDYSARPLLTFEDIWMYNTSIAVDDSSVSSRYQKYYRKWLTTIKRAPVATELAFDKLALDEPTPIGKRALIAGANGRLLSGQVTVLTGHSGSGKSVLLRVLAGLSPMRTGNIYYKDNSIHNTSATLWRAQVALLAQHPQLIEGSVLDNLQLPYTLQTHQQNHFDMNWHIEQLVYLGRTAEFLQHSALHLSGGERQLVNTLRLLQLNPQVLLLDEPTSALDTSTSAKLVRLLLGWLRAKPQRTLLWVTHDTQDILSVADRHWRMQAGVLTDVSQDHT